MKHRDLIRHLVDHGCELVREGGSQSWWQCTETCRRTAVPRHTEITDYLCRKICRDLGIAEP